MTPPHSSHKSVREQAAEGAPQKPDGFLVSAAPLSAALGKEEKKIRGYTLNFRRRRERSRRAPLNCS
eukprot:5374043-Pyramimonas_sp.AAC.1